MRLSILSSLVLSILVLGFVACGGADKDVDSEPGVNASNQENCDGSRPCLRTACEDFAQTCQATIEENGFEGFESVEEFLAYCDSSDGYCQFVDGQLKEGFYDDCPILACYAHTNTCGISSEAENEIINQCIDQYYAEYFATFEGDDSGER